MWLRNFPHNKIIRTTDIKHKKCIYPEIGLFDLEVGLVRWVVDVKMFSLLPRIYYTGASSLQSIACYPGRAHPPSPAVTVGESVGPSGLPGPQLRLASIWPDRGNTSQLKNKSNNGQTEEDEVTATQIRSRTSRIWRFEPSTAGISRRLKLPRKATNLVASHLCIPTVIRRVV